MSEASSSKAKKAAPAAEEAQQPQAPFKPAKFGLYERQVVDYVRTATARNVWYYRCEQRSYRGVSLRLAG